VLIRLSHSVNSGGNSSGDELFKGKLDESLAAEGNILAPKGSDVLGYLEEVESSDRVKGRARESSLPVRWRCTVGESSRRNSPLTGPNSSRRLRMSLSDSFRLVGGQVEVIGERKAQASFRT
jgi:hypothetical protein